METPETASRLSEHRELQLKFTKALASMDRGYRQLGDRILEAWPIIEAELQKRDQAIERTIEVLEEFRCPRMVGIMSATEYDDYQQWARVKPVLEDLKALRDGVE